MESYKMDLVDGILRVGFGTPANNDQIVKDAVARLGEMVEAGELAGGQIIRVNGPASLPVAMAIAHNIGHLYSAVACFDPKMAKYVVAISHTPEFSLGDLID